MFTKDKADICSFALSNKFFDAILSKYIYPT